MVSTDNATSLNTLNAVIATAIPGTKLRDGFSSNTKSVFFGITKTDYWTPQTEQLFRNSASWLATDFIPPTIANLSVTSITNSSALIRWDTDKNANSTVAYGTTLSLNQSKSNNALQQHQEFLLDNLNEKTTYYYKVKSCNKNNYCSESGTFNFITLDLTAPYLSFILENDLTNSSISISIEVNENSYSKVYYDNNPSVLGQSTAQSPLTTTADFDIDNLNQETTYYYLVNMCDDSGNCRNSSVFDFTTFDLTAPYLMSNAISNLTNSSVDISVEINENGYSTIYYGVSQSALGQSTSQSSLGTSAYFDINGLNQETTYYYLVNMCDDSGNCRNSSVFDFTTFDLTAPYLLSNAISNLTNSSVNISAEINEDGYLRIYYGTNPSALEQSAPQSPLTTSTNFEINSLDEKTIYYYLIEMCDDSTNCRNSSIHSFSTLDITPPNAPQNLILEVINPNNDVKIKWANTLDDAASYNIYISSNPNNFDFENPDAAVSSNEYVDSAASSAKQRYYIVRAEDAYGNEEKNNNIVGKYDLELNAGYNLVSLPLVPFTNDISDIMHQSISYKPVSEIRRFDNIGQELETNKWIIAAWNPLAFHELTYGEGYFFRSDQDTNFTIVGTLPTTAVLDIKQGMNLFGLASLENKNIIDVIAQTPADFNVSEIGKRNADGTYDLATYYPSGWYNAFGLEPGIGYWLKANKDFSLTLNP